jgi:hypothetical protein
MYMLISTLASCYEIPSSDCLLHHAAVFVEFENHFHLLITVTRADQNFPAKIIRPAFIVIFPAGVVVHIDSPLNDLAAAFACYREFIKVAIVGWGGGEEFF